MFESLGAAIESASDKPYKKYETYQEYAAAVGGAALGTSFKKKDLVLRKKLTNEASLRRLDVKIQNVAKKTPDEKFKKLPRITSDASAKKVLNDAVLVMEETIKSIQSHKGKEETEETKKELKELLQRMFRGRYIVTTIYNYYAHA